MALSVVRGYLQDNFKLDRRLVERRLGQRKRNQAVETTEEEAILDQLDQLARDHAYKQKALSESGMSVEERLAVSQEVLAGLLGMRWSERRSREANRAYERAWRTIAKPLRLPYDTDPKEMRRQQAFFALENLEKLAGAISNEDLQAARDRFTGDFYFVAFVLQEHAAGRPVSKATLSRAQRVKRIYDALFQTNPAWVWSRYLYQLYRERDEKKHPT